MNYTKICSEKNSIKDKSMLYNERNLKENLSFRNLKNSVFDVMLWFEVGEGG